MKIVKNIKDHTKASMKANNKIQSSHKVYIYIQMKYVFAISH